MPLRCQEGYFDQEMFSRIIASFKAHIPAPRRDVFFLTLESFYLFFSFSSVTVAVEIPVFLTKEDIEYYRQRRFDLGFESNIITGHIDFLQIRNGHIHILDYKPEAREETHAHVQLTIYALALARRTGLPLKFFKCGWFDEKDYFEFYPLQGVYPIPRAQTKKC
jgi:ATP-dependent exoDNAse (exonuclease V) beta subunit